MTVTIRPGFGQLVNKQKSTVFFTGNTEVTVKESILSLLSIPTEALGERRLVLPTTAIGIYLNGVFDYVGDTVRNSVNAGWGETHMSCFKLTGKLSQRITSYIYFYLLVGKLAA
jgi:hypothetical protein